MASTIPTRTKSESTLGQRGAELASGPSMRDQACTILGDNAMFNPETNLEGLVNIGTAENVGQNLLVAELIGYTMQHEQHNKLQSSQIRFIMRQL